MDNAVGPLSGMLIRAVTPDDWPAFDALFSAPGAPRNCWCMAWRATNDERRGFGGARLLPRAEGAALRPGDALRREAMRSRFAAGRPLGLLAYVRGEPIAWCSVAPRPNYRTLGGPDDHPEDPDAVWSIGCFFVRRDWRALGVMTRLIGAAVAYARTGGAGVVEAYPVAPDAPSHRFMGLVPAFAAAGFVPTGAAGYGRTVMRLAV